MYLNDTLIDRVWIVFSLFFTVNIINIRICLSMCSIIKSLTNAQNSEFKMGDDQVKENK